jgi:hypothetical protein
MGPVHYVVSFSVNSELIWKKRNKTLNQIHLVQKWTCGAFRWPQVSKEAVDEKPELKGEI